MRLSTTHMHAKKWKTLTNWKNKNCVVCMCVYKERPQTLFSKWLIYHPIKRHEGKYTSPFNLNFVYSLQDEGISLSHFWLQQLQSYTQDWIPKYSLILNGSRISLTNVFEGLQQNQLSMWGYRSWTQYKITLQCKEWKLFKACFGRPMNLHLMHVTFTFLLCACVPHYNRGEMV